MSCARSLFDSSTSCRIFRRRRRRTPTTTPAAENHVIAWDATLREVGFRNWHDGRSRGEFVPPLCRSAARFDAPRPSSRRTLISSQASEGVVPTALARSATVHPSFTTPLTLRLVPTPLVRDRGGIGGTPRGISLLECSALKLFVALSLLIILLVKLRHQRCLPATKTKIRIGRKRC